MAPHSALKRKTTHNGFLLNEKLTTTELGQISDRLFVLDQMLGRATHDVRNDHGASEVLRAIVGELEIKAERAKAMIYRRDPDCMKEAIAELAEAAECARMAALAEKNAKAETIAAVEIIPQYVAALRE